MPIRLDSTLAFVITSESTMDTRPDHISDASQSIDTSVTNVLMAYEPWPITEAMYVRNWAN